MDSSSQETPTLRDRLAMERTRLANERTLLAYSRTAIMIAATGATVLQLYGGNRPLLISGWALIVLGFAVAAIGARRFRHTASSIY